MREQEVQKMQTYFWALGLIPAALSCFYSQPEVVICRAVVFGTLFCFFSPGCPHLITLQKA